MKEKLIILIIAITMFTLGCTILVSGEDIKLKTVNIEITTDEDYISFVEIYTLDATSDETLTFWIQKTPINLNIFIDGADVDYYTTLPIKDNRYFCNISEFDITTDTIIQVSYSLNTETNKFEKELQYNTTTLSIIFDGLEIYTASNLNTGSTLNVALQKPIQGQTITVEDVPTWYFAILIILIVVILILLLRPSKKEKQIKIRDTASGSEELLSTKKALLMELLKDIEKKHRSKEISDETYHKLKDRYKQEAVEAMKQLEDMKSKVK